MTNIFQNTDPEVPEFDFDLQKSGRWVLEIDGFSYQHVKSVNLPVWTVAPNRQPPNLYNMIVFLYLSSDGEVDKKIFEWMKNPLPRSASVKWMEISGLVKHEWTFEVIPREADFGSLNYEEPKYDTVKLVLMPRGLSLK